MDILRRYNIIITVYNHFVIDCLAAVFLFLAAEAERLRLSPHGQENGKTTSSDRWQTSLAAHEAGMVAMTRVDLEQQRNLRKAESQAMATALAERQFESSPTKSSMDSPVKSSRLDSMRAALGLNKLGNLLPMRGSGHGGNASPTSRRNQSRSETVSSSSWRFVDEENAGHDHSDINNGNKKSWKGLKLISPWK